MFQLRYQTLLLFFQSGNELQQCVRNELFLLLGRRLLIILRSQSLPNHQLNGLYQGHGGFSQIVVFCLQNLQAPFQGFHFLDAIFHCFVFFHVARSCRRLLFLR